MKSSSTCSTDKADSDSPLSLAVEAEKRAENRARHIWVTAIVGLLSLQVAVGVTSILLSVGDPSVAIIPNYHQAALDWDATHRAHELTQKLGWQINPIISAVMPDNRRLVRVEIRDRKENPVPGLNVVAKVYHHARGADIFELRLEESATGVYQGATQLTDAGLWQLQLQLEGQHGIASDTREVLVK
jgi:nitrogen fixation protein FixH